MAQVTTSVTTPKKATLLPEFISEFFLGLSALCRIFRKSCEGIESVVDGGVEVTTLMLQQQKQNLLASYTPPTE